MTATWMIYSAIVVSLIAGVTALLASLRERLGQSSRGVWLGGLLFAALLVLSAPARMTPAARDTIEIPVSATIDAGTPVEAPTWVARVSALFASAQHAVDETFSQIGRWPERAHRVIGALWIAASITVAIVFALVMIGMARRRARWPHATLDDVRIRVTDGVGPMVVGVANAEIALPPWIIALPLAARRLVLAHEVEHQQARDPMLLALGGLAVLITPWHPLSWWMLRRLGVAIELDCDARVLRGGVATREYGLLLLDIAGRSRPRSLLMPWPTLGVSSHLERRLIAMTNGTKRPGMARVLGTGALALSGLLVACESKLPTSAEVEAMDGKKVVESQAAIVGSSNTPTEYTVDGRAATKAEVEALPAERVAIVEVRKQKGSGSAVAVTTKSTGSVLEERVIATPDSGSRAIRFTVTDSTARPTESSARIRFAERKAATGPATPFDGILIIDGVETSGKDLSSISPDRIARVEVVKGSAAKSRFPNDPRAEKGLIYVFTKDATKP
jgi:beta-lactamase regulating signal transducer with metallopeptidase domain